MQRIQHAGRRFTHLFLAIGLAVYGMSCAGTHAASGAGDRAEAIRLCEAHRDLEAIPLLETLYKADPADREVKERLACALAMQAAIQEGAEQTATLLRARKMMVELKAAAPLQNLSEVLLSMIPEDGKFKPAEVRKDVADAMKKGELAFAKRDFAKARASYELALALDPKNYGATVFAGDAWFAEGKMDEAIAWFARAAKLDPHQTVAFRYWGDALMKQGKVREARDRFFDAILVEPYSRPVWISLGQWAQANRAELGHPRVMPPDPKPGEDRAEAVEDGTASLAAYRAVRDAWKAELFKSKHPDEAKYRHSLDEEAAALHALAYDLAAGIKSGKITKLHPSLANLRKLEEAGLIEPYVLFARADEGIAEDFPAYREAHRDKLLTYLSRFVAPLPETDPPAAEPAAPR